MYFVGVAVELLADFRKVIAGLHLIARRGGTWTQSRNRGRLSGGREPRDVRILRARIIADAPDIRQTSARTYESRVKMQLPSGYTESLGTGGRRAECYTPGGTPIQ